MLHGASEGSHALRIVALGLVNSVGDVASLLVLMKVSLFRIPTVTVVIWYRPFKQRPMWHGPEE